MPPTPQTILQALLELGPTQLGLLALYKFNLKTHRYSKMLPGQATAEPLRALFHFPTREKLAASLSDEQMKTLRQHADEIITGKHRPFGGDLIPLQLNPASPKIHWADLENTPHTEDIKLTWEPARFGWAFTLGRAWRVTADPRYPAAFWQYFEEFQAGNPPFYGENWTSAQEVAIRLMAFTWAGQIFIQADSTTPQRIAALSAAIATHAERIPPTLIYARAQNNNHLLTEAAGLYTASLALPSHPLAAYWKRLGETWLRWCITNQIDSTGEYIQHSTNYHRLMLQTALWIHHISHPGAAIPQDELGGLRPASKQGLLTKATLRENLALATHWLYCLLDLESGGVPNLGPNDGALIFPLTSQPIQDYRPVVQSAARAFLGYSLPAGPWDEMSLWFHTADQRIKVEAATPAELRLLGIYPTTIQPADHAWAYLRTARLRSRPGHADLLHLDLWWRGLNITLDPGTYAYNAPSPWDNPLTTAACHNTVTIDGLDHFTRISRFLYLNRADAHKIKASQGSIAARHYAYAKIGVRHTRNVKTLTPEHWQIQDELLNLRGKPHTCRLHWLLPDWPYHIQTSAQTLELTLESPLGPIVLRISTPRLEASLLHSIARAGDLNPIRGWQSPTYTQKQPALSLAVEVQSAKDVSFLSEFIFPPHQAAP